MMLDVFIERRLPRQDVPVEEIVVLQFSAGQKEMRANYVNLHGR